MSNSDCYLGMYDREHGATVLSVETVSTSHSATSILFILGLFCAMRDTHSFSVPLLSQCMWRTVAVPNVTFMFPCPHDLWADFWYCFPDSLQVGL